MQKSILLTIVVVVLFGALIVLSLDGDPPKDQHLVLNEGAMPTDGNGFLVFLELVEEMDWPSDDAWIRESPRIEIPDSEAILDLIASHRCVLDRLPDVVAAAHFRVPVSGESEPFESLARARQLGRLVGLEATIRMRRGDEAGAFELLFQYLELGHRFQATGELVYYLVGAGCESIALQQIIELAADSSGVGLEALSRRIRDYGFDRDAMENALRREYMFVTSTIDEPFQQDGGWKRVPVLGWYLYQSNRTKQLFADSFTDAIARLAKDCATTTNENVPLTLAKWRYIAPNSIGYILHNIAVPNFEGFTFTRCREQMRFALAELVLALRAYRANEGQLPVSLNALVPNYLDALPGDLDGREFRYSPTEAYLYSVGENRLDEGGGDPAFHVYWRDPDPGVSLRAR